jgi:tryptophan synthase alpha chain
MNRIIDKFNTLKENKEKAFITYMMAGYPNLTTTKDLILEQAKAGVDVIEIGVPFSDPLADGPVIQEVGYQAVQNYVTIHEVFSLVEDARKDTEVPLILMLYYNTVLYYGVEKFIKACVQVGVDGLIIPDLPLEEQDEILEHLDTDDLILIQLIAPTSLKRLPELLAKAKGFIYCISSLGVTGQKDGFHSTLKDFLTTLRGQTDLPLMLGFGISQPEDMNPFKDNLDGVIVGSAFLKKLMNDPEDIEGVVKWAGDFKKAIMR